MDVRARSSRHISMLLRMMWALSSRADGWTVTCTTARLMRKHLKLARTVKQNGLAVSISIKETGLSCTSFTCGAFGLCFELAM